MRRALLLAAGLLLAAPAQAAVLNPIFQDHAVLQRDRPIPVWGRAAPGQTVEVELAGSRTRAAAGPDGRWSAVLPARPAGGPYTLTAQAGGERQALTDVMLGDVFLCSGQSNMEFPLVQATNGRAAVEGASDPQLRLLQISRRSRPSPETEIDPRDTWRPASPESASEFSAACFFMGQALRRSEKVPIGLIHPSWGGSSIQAWMSHERLAALGGYTDGLALLAERDRSPEKAAASWMALQQAWSRRTMPEATGWSAPSFDDRAWQELDTTTFWEDSGAPELRGFDGTVWLRTTVTLTAAQARQPAQLLLGPIDDIDVTYVNGRAVGGLQGWNTPRAYTLPAGVLKPGRNVLAVQAVDTGGGGGLWGPADRNRLQFADGSSVPLEPRWRYRIARPLSATGGPPQMPWMDAGGLGTLYGGMIAPLASYGLKAVAWYQGEANVADPVEYARLLPALFADWREAFRTPDLPFLVVQLANFGPPATAPEQSAWAALREAQRRVVAADPRAGLAVAIDVGDPFDIHPTNKLTVGQRLAQQARRVAYGRDVPTGPEPVSARREGANVVVTFSGVTGGLATRSSDRAIGFELCVRVCRYVDAGVRGAEVVLDAGAQPASHVRYAWAHSPTVNLYDGDGLPVVPFELPVDQPGSP